MSEDWINHPMVDVAVFAFFAGTVWLILRGNTSQQSAEEPALELSLMATEEIGENGQRVDGFERWFRRQVHASQVPFSHQLAALLMLGVGSVAGAVVLLLTDSVAAAVMIAIGALVICLVALAATAQYRVHQFRKQLPLALDIMARAVRSGDGLREAVCLLSDTMQEPAKTEFVRVRNQLDMGLSLRATMQSFSDRVGSLDAKLFATTLAVHRDTGGELSSALERMSSVIRSRFEYDRHMKATTGMGRVSVMIVVGLAWLIVAYMIVMKPEYATDLWEKPMGQQMLIVAFVLEMIGIVWVFGLMKSDY